MKTLKIELTKRQNNLVAARCKDEALKWSAKFGGMCKDYTFWLREDQLHFISDAIDEQSTILVEVE